MRKYEHLDETTRRIMHLPTLEKINWYRKGHFVLYPKAVKMVNQLEWIYTQRDSYGFMDFPSDLEGFTIIGPSGVGKTAIMQYFREKHPNQHLADRELVPVGYCMLKDSATNLKGLYSALLGSFNHPYGNAEALKLRRITVDRLENALLHVMKKCETRIFIIDEFQHVSGHNQQSILNQLKRTMLVSRVPFVPVGIRDVKDILDTDPQLSERCPINSYSLLTPWIFDDDFLRFIAGYEKFIPLPEPSNLSDEDLAYKLFSKIKFNSVKQIKSDVKSKNKKTDQREVTTLRRLTRFLIKVGVTCLRAGKKCITKDDIENAET